MRRQLFTCVLFLLILSPFADGHAQEIAIIRSAGIKPYHEVVRGFRNACKADAAEFTISGPGEKETFEKIRKINPGLILAVGLEALSRARKMSGIPVIYTMVSNPRSFLIDQKNITGVSMNVPAERQLRALLEIVPRVKRIGVVYDSRKTAQLFGDARSAASSLGIAVISKNVSSSKEVPSAINGMKGRIDAFWLLPDTTVVTPESMEHLLLFSFENKLPTLAFSDRYVEFGFLMALGIDAGDIGRQAGEIACEVLRGGDISATPMAQPEKAVLILNLKTAGKLGVHIPEDVARHSRIIR